MRAQMRIKRAPRRGAAALQKQKEQKKKALGRAKERLSPSDRGGKGRSCPVGPGRTACCLAARSAANAAAELCGRLPPGQDGFY